MAKPDESIEKLKEKHNAVTLERSQKFLTELPVLSTGIFPLDLAIGVLDPETGLPGIRCGDIAEIMGENNGFKTGTTEQLIAQTLKRYGPESVVCCFSEPPNIERMESVGINPSHIIALGVLHEDIKPTEMLAEHCCDAMLDFASYPQVKLIVIDSIGALITEGMMYDRKKLTDVSYNPVAAQAKVLNNFVNKFTKLDHRECVLWMVNHYREPINTGFSLTPNSLLRPKSGGGRGKEFMAWIRIMCISQPHWREERHSITDQRIADGLDVTYQVIKNKYAHSTLMRTVKAVFSTVTKKMNNAETILNYAKYFTRNETTKDAKGKASTQLTSILEPPVVQAGSWTSIGDERFQGGNKAAAYLEQQPEMMEKLIKQIATRQEDFFEDGKSFTAEYLLDATEELR